MSIDLNEFINEELQDTKENAKGKNKNEAKGSGLKDIKIKRADDKLLDNFKEKGLFESKDNSFNGLDKVKKENNKNKELENKYPFRPYEDYKDFYKREIVENEEYEDYHLSKITANYNGIYFDLKKNEYATGFYDKDIEKQVYFSFIESKKEYKEPPTVEELAEEFDKIENEGKIYYKRLVKVNEEDNKIQELLKETEPIKENKKNIEPVLDGDFIKKPEEKEAIYFRNDRTTFTKKVENIEQKFNHFIDIKNSCFAKTSKQAEYLEKKLGKYKDNKQKKKESAKLAKVEYKNFNCKKIDKQLWDIAQEHKGVIDRDYILEYANIKYKDDNEKRSFIGVCEMRLNTLNRLKMVNDKSNSLYVAKNIEMKNYKTGQMEKRQIYTKSNIKFEVNKRFYEKIKDYDNNEKLGYEIRREDTKNEIKDDFKLAKMDKDIFSYGVHRNALIDFKNYAKETELDLRKRNEECFKNKDFQKLKSEEGLQDDIRKNVRMIKGRLNKLDAMGYVEQLDENRYYITPLGQQALKDFEEKRIDLYPQKKSKETVKPNFEVATAPKTYSFSKDDKIFISDSSKNGIFNEENFKEHFKGQLSDEDIKSKYNRFDKRLETHVNSGTGFVVKLANGDYKLNDEFYVRAERAELNSRNKKELILQLEQENAIRDMGNFGNLTKEQIIHHIYNDNEKLFKYDFKELQKKNLVASKVVYIKNVGEVEVYKLDEKGEKIARRWNGDDIKLVKSKLDSKENELQHDLLLYDGYKGIQNRLNELGLKVENTMTDRQLRSYNGTIMANEHDGISLGLSTKYILEQSKKGNKVSMSDCKKDYLQRGYSDKYMYNKLQKDEQFNKSLKQLEENGYIIETNNKFSITEKGNKLLNNIKSNRLQTEYSDLEITVVNGKTGEKNTINVESAVNYNDDEIKYKAENISNCIWITNNEKQYNSISKFVPKEYIIML